MGLKPQLNLLELKKHKHHLETKTQAPIRGYLAWELDMDAIKMICVPCMGLNSLTTVEVGKQQPQFLDHG